MCKINHLNKLFKLMDKSGKLKSIQMLQHYKNNLKLLLAKLMIKINY